MALQQELCPLLLAYEALLDARVPLMVLIVGVHVDLQERLRV